MSLYGAMFSGVSGLDAQSQTLGTIADNIANVNTTGYKASFARFSTLVTQQATNNSYSPGGVQFSSLTEVGRQGLLQSSASPTDLAVSGEGMFVVNGVAKPTSSDPYLFTRAGAFEPDESGNLKNTADFYLQGWATDAAGVPIATNTAVLTSLETVNVGGVSGSATATSAIDLGINLPATATLNSTEVTNVQVFDSLGVAHDLTYTWTKSALNEWDLALKTPTGATNTTIENSSGGIYAASGRLDFSSVPTDGQTVVITDGTEPALTFEFDTNSSVTGSNIAVDISSSSTTTQVAAALLAAYQNYTGQYSGTTVTDTVTTGGDIATFTAPTLTPAANGVTATANTVLSALLDSSNNLVIPVTVTGTGAEIRLKGIANIKYQLNSNAVTSAGVNSDDLVGISATSTVKVFVNDSGTDVLIGTLTFSAAPTSGGGSDGDEGNITIGSFVRTNDGRLAQGTGADTSALLFTQSSTGAATVINSTGAAAITQSSNSFTVAATTTSVAALTFNGNGTPKAINIANVKVNNWASGALDSAISFDLGTVDLSDGLTQFSGAYNVTFINQNGTQFGTFSGVSISDEGLVVALFDNGETLPIYKIPLVTFANFNGLTAKTGNVYVSSDSSGVPVLRIAKTGSAGSINAGSLENSTVDLGTEFTNMILAQRAYSATTRIITTADEMLDELVRIKR
ncbi:MAG: flagellar hook-basal body complex protein [Alphaproteobacteria bacterium]|nr:flagellar hook-basal body complex protein [Alphaproteobacteria bacterium]